MKGMLVATLLAVQINGTGKQVVKASERYNKLIYAAAEKHHVDPNIITAIIALESRFDPNAVGGNGRDLGLMQLRRGGCLGGASTLSDQEVMMPKFNINRGTECLAQMIAICGNDVTKGLSKYNGRGCRAPTRYSNKVLALAWQIEAEIKHKKEPEPTPIPPQTRPDLFCLLPESRLGQEKSSPRNANNDYFR